MQKDVGFYHINYVTGKVEQRSCDKLQSGADGQRADVEFDDNWLHKVEEAILASSNAQAVEATCRDFWGRATVV